MGREMNPADELKKIADDLEGRKKQAWEHTCKSLTDFFTGPFDGIFTSDSWLEFDSRGWDELKKNETDPEKLKLVDEIHKTSLKLADLSSKLESLC